MNGYHMFISTYFYIIKKIFELLQYKGYVPLFTYNMKTKKHTTINTIRILWSTIQKL
jgi:hypothetical protein